jgi:hypothetical protein
VDCLADQAGRCAVTGNTVEQISELPTLGISIARICRPQKLTLIGRRGEFDSKRDRIEVIDEERAQQSAAATGSSPTDFPYGRLAVAAANIMRARFSIVESRSSITGKHLARWSRQCKRVLRCSWQNQC